MEGPAKLVYSCLVLFALLQLGTCLKCYECNGNQTDSDCAHPSQHKQFQIDCPADKTVCVFENITIINEPQKFMRACGTEKSCPATHKENVTCIVCSKDLCNSSTSLLPSLICGFSLILAMRYLFNL